jgi:peptidoglycan/LPS O-acetylase OafA/YrhL
MEVQVEAVSKSSGRIPSLDGIRALSILLVLLGHQAYTVGALIPQRWWTDYYAIQGVRIFFILSGYLISTLLLREREKTGKVDLKQFYIRRAYRILPVAYLYLVVLTILFHNVLRPGELLKAFTYLSSYEFNPHWSVSHLWSLSVEEQFYFIWPLAVATGLMMSRRFAWAAIIFSPLCRFALDKTGHTYEALWFPPAVADSLASGCLLALYQPKLQRFRSFFTWKGFPLIWIGTLSIPFLTHYLDIYGQGSALWPLPQIAVRAGITLFNLGIVLCIQNGIIDPPRILNHPAVVWFGVLSYSFYIWHMPFFDSDVHSWATTFPTNVVLSLLVATLSFYGFEQPFLRLREQRAKSRFKPRPSPQLQLYPRHGLEGPDENARPPESRAPDPAKTRSSLLAPPEESA